MFKKIPKKGKEFSSDAPDTRLAILLLGKNRRMINMKLLTIFLLFVGGLSHLVPVFYDWLSDLTGGNPWIQILIGLASIITAVLLLIKKENK